MISLENKIKKIWDAYILALTIVSAIEVPARLVMNYPLSGALLILDYMVSVSFLIDVVLNFLSEHIIKGKIVRSFGSVSRGYLKGWFLIDFLSAVPFDLLTGGSFVALNRLLRLFRLLRLLRLARLAQFMSKLGANQAINPVLLRLFFFIFWLGMMAHWMGCGWIALGGCPNHEGIHQYVRALYWAVTSLTTVGYGDITPADTPQTIYAMLIEIIGAGMYGYVIGNVASLLANIDVAKAHFSEKLEQVNAFLKYREIPADLQTRVRSYYDYLWESRLGYDESSVVEDLPPSLKIEISMHLNRDIIEKVPLFKGATDEFIRDIVSVLKAHVFTPGDFIVRKGELGDEMYFISRGSVEVVSENGEQVFATLQDGSYFGEIALINREPRTASIRARNYCDVYTLSRDVLEHVLQKFPEIAEQLRTLAEQRIRELQQ